MKSVARNACLNRVRVNKSTRQQDNKSTGRSQCWSLIYLMISDARRAMTDIAYGGAVRMKIYIQLYGGHIQCVRTVITYRLIV